MSTIVGNSLKIGLVIFCISCVVIVTQFYTSSHYFVMPRATKQEAEMSWCKTLGQYSNLIYIGESTDIITPQMSDEESDITFDRYLSKLHFICKNAKRLGNRLDGGWEMCLAGPYAPNSPCLVYSFGINNDFSFDDAVAKTFNCTVRSFDPSMAVGDHKRSDKVWFYKLGLYGEDTVNNKSWTLKTLQSILKQFNEQDKIIDYLKIDIEWSEWSALMSMLKSDVLSRVKQLGIELHLTVQKEADNKLLYSRYKTLSKLEKAGFRRWQYAINMYNLEKRKNGFRSCCYEMTYINTNFLREVGS